MTHTPTAPSLFFCYLLRAVTSHRTYIGSTNDLHRRLQQHNGERSGGARSTRGDQWCMVACVSGFASRRQALSFEYSWRRCCRRYVPPLPSSTSSAESTPMRRRWLALQRLFSLGNPAKKWFGEHLTVHCFTSSERRALECTWGIHGTTDDEDRVCGESGGSGGLSFTLSTGYPMDPSTGGEA